MYYDELSYFGGDSMYDADYEDLDAMNGDPESLDDERDDFDDYDGYEMSDVEADADTLASAGYGTDEDYGYYGYDDFDVFDE